jgi:acyl carrier protein
MSTTENTNARLEELRAIVAEVLEIDTDELTDGGLYVEEYGADSLRAIEILARLEKKYRVEIDQAELVNMVNLTATYDIVARLAGWQ